MTTFIKTKFKISDLESPSNFQVKEEKKIQIGQEKTKLCFNYKCQNRHVQKEYSGPESHFRNVHYRIWNPHQISKSKKFFYSNLCRNNEIML